MELNCASLTTQPPKPHVHIQVYAEALKIALLSLSD